MDYLIKDIVLDNEFDQFNLIDSKDSAIKVIPNLSKINILVGANNSGKSRFMRKLSSINELTFAYNNPNINFKKIYVLKLKAAEIIKQNLSRHKDYFGSGIEKDLNQKIDKIKFTNYSFLKESQNIFADIDWFYDEKFLEQRTSGILPRQLEEFKEIKKDIDSIINSFPKNISFKKLYIPTLRGLRTYQEWVIATATENYDIYKKRTKQDYFNNNEKTPKPEIFTGLDLYIKIRDFLLGNLEEREIVANFEKFLSETFFNNDPIALIPRKDENVLVVKIGHENEFPIYNLGDGIQSIITLTFPLFAKQNENLLVFIEEPEIYMHPGLQRIFLNTLLSFKNHQFFLTTHSNHFLDITFDFNNISIYTFKKLLSESESRYLKPTFKVQNISNDDHCSLKLLGVKNSSVFLSNCTIWVEGITDRKYLSHYLKMYQDHLKSENKIENFLNEDLHFSFVEYSGSNITHWSFLNGEDSINVDRLCSKLFLVADQDDSNNQSKKQRHEKLKEKLGNRFYRLECREIENLLTPDILKKVIEDYEGIKPEFPEFNQEKYKEVPLGEFIEENILKGKKKRKAKYSNDSGTISQKLSFCEKALSYIKNFDDLSNEAKKLTILIYDFIKENN